MKNAWKRIFALSLCLVLVAVLLPAFPAEAAAGDLTSEGIVLIEDDFTQYTETGSNVITNQDCYSMGSSPVVIADYNGEMVLKAGDAKTQNRYIWITADVNIPKSYSNMTFYIKLEAEIYAPTRKYLLDLNSCLGSDDSTSLDSSSKPARLDDYVSTGYTAEFTTVTSVWQVKSGVGTLKARLGAANDSSNTDPVYIKSYKITLLPAEVSSATESADFIAAMAYDDVYTKLSSNFTVNGPLELGANAVLDLNGYTLTVVTGDEPGTVDAAAGARIIDSSASKSGKLAVAAEGALTFDAGATNGGQLPLWTGSAYIFTTPELGDQRAIFVSESADGFVLDFRPGFGTAGNKNVRESYLFSGNSGIQMDAELSWTDIYGNEGGPVSLYCDGIFDGMYLTKNSRGRLTLTGAEQYQSISLGLTLSSCGVTYSFDPITFTNSYVTKLYAANFDDGKATGFKKTTDLVESDKVVSTVANGVLTIAGTDYFTLDQAIVTGSGKKLVIEFDLPNVEKANNFALRVRKTVDSKNYIGLLYTSSCSDSHPYGNFYGTSAFAEADPVTVRMEIDLGNGDYEVTYGGNTKTGTNPNYSSVFADVSALYIYTSSYSNDFDNLLVYIIENAQ